MANEKRLIDANALKDNFMFLRKMWSGTEIMATIDGAPTEDAYTEEQVANIIQLSHQLHATNVELEKELAWLKSCLNCKMRKECQRHCGKVVHDCDHWEYGDSTVDAVEVVHGRWIWTVTGEEDYEQYYRCSKCNDHMYSEYNYCPNCGAKMDGGNEDG